MTREPAFWATAALAAAFLVVGLGFTFWPFELQQYAVKIFRGSSLVKRAPFVVSFAESRSYALMLRLVGIFSLLAGLLALWATFNP